MMRVPRIVGTPSYAIHGQGELTYPTISLGKQEGSCSYIWMQVIDFSMLINFSNRSFGDLVAFELLDRLVLHLMCIKKLF